MRSHGRLLRNSFADPTTDSSTVIIRPKNRLNPLALPMRDLGSSLALV
jgi:hypothetical protein